MDTLEEEEQLEMYEPMLSSGSQPGSPSSGEPVCESLSQKLKVGIPSPKTTQRAAYMLFLQHSCAENEQPSIS